MSLQLDIPDELFDPKPFYRTRDSAQAVLREIKEHIKTTGEPHLWRHHTHSKPVTGSRIVYIGEFDLPASHQAPDRHAPCPCCSPRAPKFSRKGKIAWFPDEHIIRMIGPECFQTLNPEGHWEAVEVFNREEAERRTIAYLVTNLHLNVHARDVIRRALPALEAIDQVHTTLQRRINDVLRLDLWRHVGRGSLSVNVEGRRMKRVRGGAQEVETFMDVREFTAFPGSHMFSPKTSRLASRADGCAKRLSLIDFGDEVQERVRGMTTEEQAKAARILSKGISAAADIFKEANAIRSGFGPMSIANLKGWTKHAGCPIRLFISGDESSFYIGTDEQHELRIEIPPTFWRTFGELPTILTVANWNED
ncbi:hypothetical protein J2R76_007412 [Bradyrhizobium sp. USDA 4532]|uniref:hypothetical protein n=1 Tax=unclassified Bradyrhizobium TaxID=2631580 RepID=UPI00209CA771|nr:MULTISPECIES: hypothetical protein [unclassified Bradyrhizobium]MCP1830712.1 hypothetical protein [Bradyrhizobium sp. USDA 4545]MCP1923821.1 hypothetical protein [Bradyrhizobium sp. USDA 4532]